MSFVFETERLGLRCWTEEDLDDIRRIYSHPEVQRFLSVKARVLSREDAQAYLKRRNDHQQAHGFCFWAVILKESSRLVGCCGLQLLDGGEKIEVGFHFDREHWGLGYASEAGRGSLDYGFSRLGIDSLYAVVNPENTASMRVLEKIGLEAKEPGYYYDTDVIVFHARSGDWQERLELLRSERP